MQSAIAAILTARRNDWFATLIEDRVHQAVGIVGPVGNDMFGVKAGDEVVSLRHVILLSRSGQ
jgi:hypothetical protein